MDAKYHEEYLREQQACIDHQISREVFIYSCKRRDGIDCEYPGEAKLGAPSAIEYGPEDERFRRLYRDEQLACESVGLTEEQFVDAMRWQHADSE